MNRDRHGWLARRIPSRLFAKRLTAPGRPWRWHAPRRVVSPGGRVFEVHLHAGIRLRPVKSEGVR